MASEPDFDKLRRGELYFPPGARQEPDSPAGPARFATAATWADWSRAGRAEVWKLVALSVHLDPQFLPWQDIPESTDPRTAHGLFVERMREVMHDVLGMSLGTVGEIPKQWELSVVRVVDFVRCAERDAIRLPALFPTGDGPAEPFEPSAPRRTARAQRDTAPPPLNGLMRQPEVLAMVGCSAATLWRWVKAETFPQPSKVSPGITAWKRSEVEAWVAAQVAPDGRRRRAGKRASSS